MDKFLGKFIYKIICKIIDGFPVEDLKQLESKTRQLLFRKKFITFRFVSFLNWQATPIPWNDYTSPWRPSKDDLKSYAQMLSVLDKNCRILILGATPELRDLVASMGFKPVVADFSLPMIVEMMKYTKRVNADDEIWIKSNWLDMPISGGFDVVLGDLVLRMIEASQQEEFLNKIRRILSPQGVFATRVHFVDESLFSLTGDEILSMLPTLNEHSAAYAISGRVFDKFSNLNKNIVFRKEALEFIQDVVKRAKNIKEKNIFLKSLKFIFGGAGWQLASGIGYSAYNEVQLNNLVGEFFNISDVKISGDYPDSKFYPIYFLKNK